MIDERKREVIERESVQKTTAEVATYLQKTLGQKMTAYLSGLKDTKEVGQWASGEVAPRLMAESRLRYAYIAVRMLSTISVPNQKHARNLNPFSDMIPLVGLSWRRDCC